MRFVLPILLVLGLAGAIALNTGTDAPRADYTFISRGSINLLDPGQMSYMQDIRIAQTIWEGLTTLHPKTTEPMEGVAYFPPEISEDRLRYLFTLRPDARWQNGDPVIAADFVRGWRRAIEPGTADVYAELISNHISGVREYVDWRLAFVEGLGVIRQVQDSTKLDPAATRKLLSGALKDYIIEQFGLDPAEVPTGDADSGWAEIAARITRDNRNWKRMGDRLLRQHVREMDERWAGVGVRALDDHHLEVRLARPTSYFLDLTSFANYLPVHESIETLQVTYTVPNDGDPARPFVLPLTDRGLWATDPQWTKPDYHTKDYTGVVCNGPYVLNRWEFKQHMRLEANPKYWNAANVRSKSIEMIDIEYANTAFMMYDQGHVDMLAELTMDYTPELIRQMRSGRRNDIHPIPSFGTYQYAFNCRPVLWDGQRNPLADPRVRRALAMAINKRDLVENAYPRLGNPVLTTEVPPGAVPGYRSPTGLPYDPDRARRELAEAGYPGGREFPVLPMLYNTGFSHELAAQAIKRMWERELGIRVDLVGKETKTFAEDKLAGRFAIARDGWYGDYNDPTTFLDLYQTRNGQNVMKWSDARYDALLAQAAIERDSVKRLALLSEAERILVEEGLPVVPLYQYVTVYAWRPEVKGIYPNPRVQFPLQYVHVERN